MRSASRGAAPLLLVLAAGCSRTRDGVDAWNDGRFEDAHRAFAEAAESAGDGATAALHWDHALAALRIGRLTEAETAADAAAEKGGGEFAALRDFLRGNAAFARSDVAAAQAGSAEAEPFALDVAIAHAETARRSWIAAAASRRDWPEARRNVERANLRLEALRKRKSETEASRKKPGAPEPRPVPIPPPPDRRKPPDAPGDETAPDRPKEPGTDAPTEAQTVELTPEAVARLFEVLEAREREKAAIRRSRRAARGGEVERDW